MGASQSASRRITIENDSESVIKISDAVAQRLKNSGDSSTNEDSAQKQQNVRNSGISDSHYQPNAGSYPYSTHPFITSHQIRQEIDRELQENNAYWEKRISSLQADQEKMNRVMEEEYLKSTEELEKALPRVPPKNGQLPCQDKKATVINCFKANSKQPLLCSKEVQDFSSCMTNIRVQLQNENKLH